MCGIAAAVGSWSPERAGQAVQRMLAAQVHRGPDDAGAVVKPTSIGAAAVGNRRLSVLDVSHRGHQPMIDETTGAVLVYNGEIYNFLELRVELQSFGCSFVGHSDTEVLLHAYRQWGRNCLDRLRGMFAFAIWEPLRERLFVARDALGIKPLYYTQIAGQGLLIASELRAILASDFVPARIDRRGLASYLAYGAVQEPLTLIENVQLLAPGTWLEADASGTPVSAGVFWEMPAPDTAFAASEDALVEEGRVLLTRAVSRHMRSDVPVGVFLSSGLDSTAVLALARKAVPGSVHAFTVAFPNARAADESAVARQTAQRIGAQYHECAVDLDTAASWAQMALGCMDQPVMDGVNTYIVSRAVHEQGLIVALSGQGGDEVFGGYPSFTSVPSWYSSMRWLQLMPGSVRRAAAAVATARLDRVARSKARDIVDTGADVAALYFQRRRLLSNPELGALGLAAGALGLTPTYHAPGIDGSKEVVPGDVVASIRRLETGYYLRNILLRDGDVFGMASSLEIRVPMLDRDVVDWAFRIPGRRLLPRGKPGKHLLRRICQEFYTSEQLAMPKKGFAPPFGMWLLGPLRDFMEASLQRLKDEQLLEPAGIDAVRDAFLRQPYSAAWSRLWALTTLGAWIDTHRASNPAIYAAAEPAARLS